MKSVTIYTLFKTTLGLGQTHWQEGRAMLTFCRELVNGDMALLEENLQHRFKLTLADLTRESKVDLNSYKS